MAVSYNSSIQNQKDLRLEPVTTISNKSESVAGNAIAEGDIFRLLVNSVKDYAIFVLDPDGYVMTWNEGAQRIKGFSADEIVGKHFSTFYTEEAKRVDHPASELKMAIENGRYEEEGIRIRKDGTTFWASVIITPLYTNNKLVGFAKVTRDLTERKKAEELLEAHAKQVTDSNEELQRLAYVVSHELQPPVSTITRYSNLLSVRYKDRLGDDANDFIDKITTSTKLTARMIDDLWDYARISKPYIDHESVFIGGIIDNLLKELSDTIGENEVTFDELPTIEGNKQQLSCLFREVIRNAFMYRSNAAPRVRIDAKREDNGWTFSVSDNGIGIDMVRSNEVFTLFHRLCGNLDADATGIGLATCKKIVEQHNGRIWFESSPGKGSTFFFWLPERTTSAYQFSEVLG